MRAGEGVEYSSNIFDLGSRWSWVVSFTSRPLYPWRKSPHYPLVTRLAGPYSRSVRCAVEKNLLPLPGIEPWLCSPSL
jgi:hypothetical protein